MKQKLKIEEICEGIGLGLNFSFDFNLYQLLPVTAA